jgi:hypothetical protein
VLFDGFYFHPQAFQVLLKLGDFLFFGQESTFKARASITITGTSLIMISAVATTLVIDLATHSLTSFLISI